MPATLPRPISCGHSRRFLQIYRCFLNRCFSNSLPFHFILRPSLFSNERLMYVCMCMYVCRPVSVHVNHLWSSNWLKSVGTMNAISLENTPLFSSLSSSSSVALQPRSGLGLPYGFHDSYSTMWVISSTIVLVRDTLIQPSETSSSNYQTL
jgi:hypothetical protein